MVRWLRELLWRLRKKPAPLNPGTLTYIWEATMARVVLTLAIPPTRKDGSAATAADVSEVLLETRNDAGSYTPLGNPLPPTQKTVNVDNVPAGKFWYRATWKDSKGAGDSQAEISITLALAGLSPGTIAAALG